MTDILTNLSNFNLESVFADVEEEKISTIESRHFALLANICANATYFTGVLKSIRKHIYQYKSEAHIDVTETHAIDVGIIGYGMLGRELADAMLHCGGLHPSELKISTRRPELLESLSSTGVDCRYDNRHVASSVHVLFLCVLPSQLPFVVDDIRGHISARCTVYSLVPTYSTKKLFQLLNHPHIIKPNYKILSTAPVHPFLVRKPLRECLALHDVMLATCPTAKVNRDIEPDPSLPVLFIYGFVNMCVQCRQKVNESLLTIEKCVFYSKTNQLERINSSHFVESLQPKIFPRFDLVAVQHGDGVFIRVFQSSETLQNDFTTSYVRFFKDTMGIRH